jgi:hypothetical protein
MPPNCDDIEDLREAFEDAIAFRMLLISELVSEEGAT